MRCYVTCSAESFNTSELLKALNEKYTAKMERDVIHVEIPTQFDGGNVFCFPYGCIVLWGLSKEVEEEIIQRIKPYQVNPLGKPIEDTFTYSSAETSKIENGEILLASKSMLSLLAVSHALAQSVKLDAFEERIQRTVDLTKHIPQELSEEGKVSLSRKEIRKKMGALFLERSSINLHFDILDKPEFFWEYPDLEPLYAMMAHYLDIETRVEVLNQRLGVIHDLFDMLNSELNHQQSSRLEIVIIVLILIEVVVVFSKDVFKIL